jgi:hypothetical protein
VHTLLLRESGKVRGIEIDPREIVEGGHAAVVPHGELLERFVDAVLGDDAGELERSRPALRSALGEAAFVQASAIVAHFSMMVRVADGTGIPLDPPMAVLTHALRHDAGINRYGRDRRPGIVLRALGALIAPLSSPLFRFASKKIAAKFRASSSSRASRRQ